MRVSAPTRTRWLDQAVQLAWRGSPRRGSSALIWQSASTPLHEAGAGGGAEARLRLLLGGFAKTLADAAHAQAQGQIAVGAMLTFRALVAGAGGLAAGEEWLHAGSPQNFGGQAELAQEGGFTRAQGEGGFALEFEYPGQMHYGGWQRRPASQAKAKTVLQSENAPGRSKPLGSLRRWRGDHSGSRNP